MPGVVFVFRGRAGYAVPVKAALLVLACAAGCGDNATPDAPSAACVFGPWSQPQREAGLSSTEIDWGPSLARDGTEMVFASNRSGPFLLYEASRAGSDWSPPQPIAEIPGNAQDPSLSSDRLELYWGSVTGIDHARRATVGGGWLEIHTLLPDTAAYTHAGGPDISRDGLTLLFTATSTSDGDDHEWLTTRASTTDPFGPGLQATDVSAATGDAHGSLRGDGLEIIYQNTAGSQLDLHAATRTAATARFGAPARVEELDTLSNEGDPDLSDDGATLTFASDRPEGQGWDIYTTTRACN